MYNLRLCFEKRDTAAYLSHLDLMKCLQRSFVRAGLPVKYSQGFNPHIEMSILAPLSTGYETVCDLCDLGLEGDAPADLLSRLNRAMPRGLRATAFGPSTRPAREIGFFVYDITLPAGDEEAMAALFEGPVLLDKRSKRGTRQVDLRDYLREIGFSRQGERTVCRCTVAGGNDPLNPAYVTEALKRAGLTPEDGAAGYLRQAILDQSGENFRDF